MWYRQQEITAFRICEAILDTYKDCLFSDGDDDGFDLDKEFDEEWARQKNNGKKPEG
jgi:hypothetical protein